MIGLLSGVECLCFAAMWFHRSSFVDYSSLIGLFLFVLFAQVARQIVKVNNNQRLIGRNSRFVAADNEDCNSVQRLFSMSHAFERGIL